MIDTLPWLIAFGRVAGSGHGDRIAAAFLLGVDDHADIAERFYLLRGVLAG